MKRRFGGKKGALILAVWGMLPAMCSSERIAGDLDEDEYMDTASPYLTPVSVFISVTYASAASVTRPSI